MRDCQRNPMLEREYKLTERYEEGLDKGWPLKKSFLAEQKKGKSIVEYSLSQTKDDYSDWKTKVMVPTNKS